MCHIKYMKRIYREPVGRGTLSLLSADLLREIVDWLIFPVAMLRLPDYILFNCSYCGGRNAVMCRCVSSKVKVDGSYIGAFFVLRDCSFAFFRCGEDSWHYLVCRSGWEDDSNKRGYLDEFYPSQSGIVRRESMRRELLMREEYRTHLGSV
jgi:hypothetical protein